MSIIAVGSIQYIFFFQSISICRSGRRNKEASEKLLKLGYTNIVEFGGILDWTGEIIAGE